MKRIKKRGKQGKKRSPLMKEWRNLIRPIPVADRYDLRRNIDLIAASILSWWYNNKKIRNVEREEVRDKFIKAKNAHNFRELMVLLDFDCDDEEDVARHTSKL
jgi:hypothetical protein